METDLRSVTMTEGATRAHAWSAERGPADTVIGCNGEVVYSSAAVPDYALQPTDGNVRRGMSFRPGRRGAGMGADTLWLGEIVADNSNGATA